MNATKQQERNVNAMENNIPKYIKLYQQLKTEILAGKYSVGDFLPKEEQLITMYNASRTTVRHAISLLKEENLISVTQGRGTEVLPIASSPSDFRKFGPTNTLSVRYLVEGEYKINVIGSEIDRILASGDIAKKLELPEGTEIYRLQKIQTINSIPFAYMIHYLHPGFLPDLEQYNRKIFHLADFVKEAYGLVLTGVDESISAISSGFVESHMLNIESGTALLSFKRTSKCKDGIFEYGETIIRPDIFEIVVTSDGNADLMGDYSEFLHR